MTCDMPTPCKFPSLARSGSCGSTRKLTLLHTRLFVFQVRDTEKCPQALTLEPLFQSRQAGSCVLGIEEDGGGKRLVQRELASEADGVALPDPA